MTDVESADWDLRLPKRLFATDRYPDSRINIYSKIDILCSIRKAMAGTPEFKRLRRSCFGPLFRLPVSRCAISCKLIQALICRQLVTNRKYELWTVFGGQPLRFSLSEFASVSGLPCGDFPLDYDPDAVTLRKTGETYFWDELFAGYDIPTLDEMTDLMNKSTGDTRLRLALILIVDCVLIATHQVPRPTLKYVEMVKDIDSFLAFQWGRESFLKTIACLKPVSKSNGKPIDPEETFAKHLQQHSFRLQGFPLALQLLAFENISGLCDAFTDVSDNRSFLKWSSKSIPKQSTCGTDVLVVELSEDLTVRPFADSATGGIECLPWDGEITDRKVDFLVDQIKIGHLFKKAEWPGGYNSLPPRVVPEKKQVRVGKKHAKTSKSKDVVRSNLSPKSSSCKRQGRRGISGMDPPVLNSWLKG